MALHLKNDWKAAGKNPAAQRLADWMNTVSNLFNFASVPSGGTAQATPIGFQIEVAGADDFAKPFDLRVNSGKIEMWLPYATAHGEVPGGEVLYQGSAVQYKSGDGLDAGWNEVFDTASDREVWIVIRPAVNDGNNMVKDYTCEANGYLEWLATDSPPGDVQDWNYQLKRRIGTVKDGVVEQHYTGFIVFQHDEPDSLVTDNTLVYGTSYYKSRSLERNRGWGNQLAGQGALRDYGWTNPQEPDSPSDVRILVRSAETESGKPVAVKRYMTPETLIDLLDSGGWLADWLDAALAEYDDDENPFPVPHKNLVDIVDQTVGDDHRGGRTAADAIPYYTGETTGDPPAPVTVDGHPVLHCAGNESRNSCTRQMRIADHDSISAIAPAERWLLDTASNLSIDWQARQGKDSSSVVSLDWSAQQPSIADVPTAGSANAADNAAAINAILVALRAYKIIADPP